MYQKILNEILTRYSGFERQIHSEGEIEMSNEDKAYDVYLHRQFKRIGFKIGPGKGGLVYDKDQNVVGAIQRGAVRGEWVLSATKSHHTGRQWDGEVVVWDNRPSKVFN
jgi:hypothetical protein